MSPPPSLPHSHSTISRARRTRSRGRHRDVSPSVTKPGHSSHSIFRIPAMTVSARRHGRPTSPDLTPPSPSTHTTVESALSSEDILRRSLPREEGRPPAALPPAAGPQRRHHCGMARCMPRTTMAMIANTMLTRIRGFTVGRVRFRVCQRLQSSLCFGQWAFWCSRQQYSCSRHACTRGGESSCRILRIFLPDFIWNTQNFAWRQQMKSKSNIFEIGTEPHLR